MKGSLSKNITRYLLISISIPIFFVLGLGIFGSNILYDLNMKKFENDAKIYALALQDTFSLGLLKLTEHRSILSNQRFNVETAYNIGLDNFRTDIVKLFPSLPPEDIVIQHFRSPAQSKNPLNSTKIETLIQTSHANSKNALLLELFEEMAKILSMKEADQKHKEFQLKLLSEYIESDLLNSHKGNFYITLQGSLFLNFYKNISRVDSDAESRNESIFVGIKIDRWFRNFVNRKTINDTHYKFLDSRFRISLERLIQCQSNSLELLNENFYPMAFADDNFEENSVLRGNSNIIRISYQDNLGKLKFGIFIRDKIISDYFHFYSTDSADLFRESTLNSRSLIILGLLLVLLTTIILKIYTLPAILQPLRDFGDLISKSGQNLSEPYLPDLTFKWHELQIIYDITKTKLEQIKRQRELLDELHTLQVLIEKDSAEEDFLDEVRRIYRKFFHIGFKSFRGSDNALIFDEGVQSLNDKNHRAQINLDYLSQQSRIYLSNPSLREIPRIIRRSTQPELDKASYQDQRSSKTSFSLQAMSVDEQVRFYYHKRILKVKFLKNLAERRQLDLAANIQKKLLPVIKQILPQEYFEIDATYRPASILGGDFWGIEIHAEQRIDCYIADVSGKGLGAALHGAMIKSYLQAQLVNYESNLEQIMNSLNYEILEQTDPNVFCTLFLARLDFQKQKMQYASAGHNQMFLIRNQNLIELSSVGLPLGMLSGYPYVVKEISILSGDLIFLYTDGVVDAQNQDERFFGLNRTKNMVVERSQLRVTEINQLIEEEIDRFRIAKEQSDDITWVLLRVL